MKVYYVTYGLKQGINIIMIFPMYSNVET